jgi:hypothetical protein
MGRPKKYANAADRQAAHRAKLKAETVVVDKSSIEELDSHLLELFEAVNAANKRHDPLAATCVGPTINAMLANTAAYFRRKAANAKPTK